MATPMSPADRAMKEFQGMMGLRNRKQAAPEDDAEFASQFEGQYTLTFVPQFDGNAFQRLWYRLMHSVEDGGMRHSSIYNHLTWSFRASFLGYMVVALIQYMVIIVFFAGLIMLLSHFWPSCTYPRLAEVHDFMGIFALSWTTYSTVGYGNSYPEVGQSVKCLPITLLASIEAWIGILHGAFVGAVLFAKVQTIYCCATVVFSDACVIKYGDGVDYGQESDNEDEVYDKKEEHGSESFGKIPRGIHFQTTEESNANLQKSPFPVLTFRIVNELYNTPRGDIINLAISAVAIVPTNKFESIHEGRRVNRRTYPTMKLQPSMISIFERSSYVRHTLDGKSPLLSLQARKKIRQNKGRWPPEFNDYRVLRGKLCFSQISVSLQGISNISKQTVYAQKTYRQVECRIGWQFVGVIYADRNKFCVDMGLINDVVEQEGGGSEPLQRARGKSMEIMIVSR